jgi:glycosyltransferase involved in cell wall biosynthesis
LRILQVIPAFSDTFGGPVTVVKNISRQLARKHEVTIYTTTALDSKHDSFTREEKVDGYKVVFFNKDFKQLSHTDLLGHLSISFGMFKAVKSNLPSFDVVHVHSWQQFPDLLVSHFASKYHIPLILQAHGSVPIIGKRFRKQIFTALFGNTILKKPTKFIALSQIEASQYRSIGINAERIQIIPNCIDPIEYSNSSSIGAFKKKIGMNEDQKLILYLGRIHKTKGINLLIKAYSYLTRNLDGNFDSSLAIVGPDDGSLSEIRSLVESLHLSGKVVFRGFINRKEKIAALRDAEIFVTPSFYGFPLTFLEACASGTPLITTTMGDTLNWISGNVGLVTKPNEQDLAKAMYSLLNDNSQRQRFSNNCRNYISNEFSAEKIVSKLESIYADIV